MVIDHDIRLDKRSLPILYDVDAVIVGGSFAGVSAAVELAKNGKKAALVESRTYLGREMTATLRPWLDINAQYDVDSMLEIIHRIANAGVVRDSEIALCMDEVKIHLEDVLMEAGVHLLYGSIPIAIHEDENRKKILVIGNKSGRQVIKADLVIDTTETATISRLAGESIEPVFNGVFHMTIEMDRVKELDIRELNVPETIGIVDHTVSIHQGYRDGGHVLLEFKLQCDVRKDGTSIDHAIDKEIHARHTTMSLAKHLIQQHEAFHNAYLSSTSYEMLGMQWRLTSVQDSDTLPDLYNVPIHGSGSEMNLSDFIGSDSRIWNVNETVPIETIGRLFYNPVISSAIGQSVAAQFASKWEEISQFSIRTKQPVDDDHKNNDQTNTSKWTVAELNQPQEGKLYSRQDVPAVDVPILHHADVLVVGGGTSGAAAAITSAKEGMDTVLLEMNPGLGGTATLGGVDSYWFGRRVGFNTHITELVDDIHKKINHRSPKWNIEAKMYALLKEAEKDRVRTYFHTTTIGTIMENNRVRGVVVATKWGMYAVLAEAVIDASGDGDVAAFAGSDHIYGSERDHIVMWYSLAQFSNPGRSQNNFTSMVQISNIEDYTRAILDGRRRKRKENCHDHGIYIASRETRHIHGEVVMTLTDQLKHREWEDVVNIHFSNHDMKGKNGADWMHLGLIPPNLEIEIPYRMLIPRKVEGILIVGKAISATHDAFAAIRMQSDLENLGGVAAIAAAQSIRDHQLPRDIDVTKLQKRLVKEGLLQEEILDRTIKEREYTDRELEELVESLTGDQPLYMYADMEMDEIFTQPIPIVEVCTAGPRVIPYLKKRLDLALEQGDAKRKILLAQALSMYESDYGVDVLKEEIEREFSTGILPVRDNAVRHTQLPPDQGAMPDVTYLLYTLGMAKDKRSIAVWEKVADMIDPTEENLKDMYKGTFYYVDAVCYGIERLADPGCISILEKLHSHPTLREQTRTSGIEADYFKERQAMLDLGIARALASCGSKKGYTVLISYLDDIRSLLAEHAHSELKRLTGKDYSKNKHQWKCYLDKIQYDLQPQPVRFKLDMDEHIHEAVHSE